MDKVREGFDYYRNDVDDVLYYNLDEYNRMLDEEEIEEARKKAREEGREEGLELGRKEGILENQKLAVKNMLDNNLSDELILNCLNIDEHTLLNIKKSLN